MKNNCICCFAKAAVSMFVVLYLFRAQESAVDGVEEQDGTYRQGKKFALILVMAREACLRL